MSKEGAAEKVLEITSRLIMLSEEDKEVLRSIEDCPIDNCKIAAASYILPSRIDESIERLLELGFVSQISTDTSSRYSFCLSERGIEAQFLLDLMPSHEM